MSFERLTVETLKWWEERESKNWPASRVEAEENLNRRRRRRVIGVILLFIVWIKGQRFDVWRSWWWWSLVNGSVG